METLNMIDEKIKSLRYYNQETVEGIQMGHIDFKTGLDKLVSNNNFIRELIISKRLILMYIKEHKHLRNTVYGKIGEHKND